MADSPTPLPAPARTSNLLVIWLAIVLVAALAFGAGWLTADGPQFDGAEWALQPDVPDYGLSGAGPGDWSAADSGWNSWSFTQALSLATDPHDAFALDARVIFSLAVMLIGLLAALICVRQHAATTERAFVAALFVGVVAALSAGHPLNWLPASRLPTVVGWAVAMVWFALATRAGLHRVWRNLAPLTLAVALLIEPAACVFVLAAFVWRRVFPPAPAAPNEPAAPALRRDFVRLTEVALALVALMLLVVPHIVQSAPLVSPAMLSPLWLAVGSGSLALLALIAVVGLRAPAPDWRRTIGGIALITAGCALAGWLDVRGARDTWWWSCLALIIAAMVLGRHALTASSSPRSSKVALLVVGIFAAGLAVDQTLVWPKVVAPDGPWFRARALADSLRNARDVAPDYPRACAAYRRVIAQADTLAERYHQSDSLAALNDAVQLPRVYLAAAEAELGLARQAKRIIDGRRGRNLPVRVQLPDDYPVSDEVTVPLADAQSMVDVQQVPWLDFYRSRVAAFRTALQRATNAIAAMPPAGWPHHFDARLAQRQLQVMAASLLELAPADADDGLVDGCIALARAAFGDAAGAALPLTIAARPPAPGSEDDGDVHEQIAPAQPPPPIRQLDTNKYLAWLARTLDDAMATTPEPGLTADVARVFWHGGAVDAALGLLAHPAGRADAAAQQFTQAAILFDTFNRELASAKSAADETAARAAWTQSVAIVDALLATPPVSRRLALDARRLHAMQVHFGPDEASRNAVLASYQRLLAPDGYNPPMRQMRVAPVATTSGTQRDYDIVPCSGEPDVSFLAGTLFLGRKAIKEATIAFADELQRDPRHTLARYQLGHLQYLTARAQYELLVDEYTSNYKALPRERQRPEVETLRRADGRPMVPLWALEEAFGANDGFMRRITDVTNLSALAWDTDPSNSDIRELWSTLNYFRGDANRALDKIDLAENYLRTAYTAWPDNPVDINGVRIGDKLGHFYAEVWKQLVSDPNEKPEAVYDLLSRALRISKYVRDQLWDFAKGIIIENPDWTSGRLHPFYSIAAELYPDWAPAQHWLAKYHQECALLTPAQLAELAKTRGIVLDPAAEWKAAETHLLAALESMRKSQPGSDEWATVLLETAQFYVARGATLQAQARLLRNTSGAEGQQLALRQQAWATYEKARERVGEFLRFSNVTREVGVQTDAIIAHERYRLAAQMKMPGYNDLLLDAVHAYQRSLTPGVPDANMEALRGLMTRHFQHLREAKAPIDQQAAWLDDIEKWLPPPPSSWLLMMRARLQAEQEMREIQPLIDAGKLAEARAAVESLLIRSPHHTGLEMICGELCEQLGDLVAANGHYQLASRGTPSQLMALWRSARIDLQRPDGRVIAAPVLREFIRRAEKELPAGPADPDDPTATPADAELAAALKAAREALGNVDTRAAQLAEDARTMFDSGLDYARAEELMREALARDREQPEWLFTHGEILEALGRKDDAEAQFAAAAGHGHLLALYSLAMIWSLDIPRTGAAIDGLREFRRAVDSRVDAGKPVDVRAKVTYRLAESSEADIVRAAMEAGDKGMKAVAEQRWADAVPLLEHLFYANYGCAGRSHGYEPLLTALSKLGRTADLVVWAQRAIRGDLTDSRKPGYHLLLARTLLALPAPLPTMPRLAPFVSPAVTQRRWAMHSLDVVIKQWPASAEAATAKDIIEQQKRIPHDD
ncbi:MAG: hypothetical protein AB7K09_02655 [Planctomycetota bacterium]